MFHSTAVGFLTFCVVPRLFNGDLRLGLAEYDSQETAWTDADAVKLSTTFSVFLHTMM